MPVLKKFCPLRQNRNEDGASCNDSMVSLRGVLSSPGDCFVSRSLSGILAMTGGERSSLPTGESEILRPDYHVVMPSAKSGRDPE